jgi:hypothetical protein
VVQIARIFLGLASNPYLRRVVQQMSIQGDQ